jgi:transglutaminase-like putative cysteine protease
VSHRLTVSAAAATVATSLVLYPLLANAIWFWEGVAAAIVVAAAGTLTRLRPLPAAACLAAALAVLLLYLNMVFAGTQSFARLVPTRSSLHHLWVLAGKGLASVHRYAPPVPAGHGILLLATAGIGVIAVATDLVAVRLRRPALAGLPLLVLFCVPLSTSAPPGPVGTVLVFGLAVSGYLALLAADGRERVRLWGRLVSVWQSGRTEGMPETRKLAAAGRRIGFAAAALALFVPLLLPGRPAHRLLGSGSGAGTGPGGTVALPDPLAVLNQQLHESRARTVLTYRTADPSPPYLQVYVLGQLSDNAWTLGRDALAANGPVSPGRLPGAPGLNRVTPGPALREQIGLGSNLAASGHGLSYLPVPYPAQSISVPGSWRVDRRSLTIFAENAGLAGLRYAVTAKDVNPSPQQLRQTASPPAAVLGYLPVPRAYSQLRTLAQRVTKGRDTAYGRAVALQRWFTQTGHFSYSLNVAQPRNADALVNFLTRSKRGYCQQFAFSMAVLARLLGIPSRVVVGYTQGTFLGGTRWRVTTRDAHAWPELYFQGAGWLRFEPTPDGSAGPGQATASAPGYSFAAQSGTITPQTPAAATPGPAAGGSSAGRAGQLGGLHARPPIPDGGAAGHGAQAPGHSLPFGWLVTGVLGLVLITPRSTRSVTRRRRWLTAAHDAGLANAAWLELTDDLADHGIGYRPSESPRNLAQRLTSSLELTAPERAAFGRLVSAVERARYSTEPAAAGTLRTDVTTIRRAVARAAGPAARWQARLMPISALAPYRAGLQQALDVFGWLDRLTTRVNGRAVWDLRRAARRRAG